MTKHAVLHELGKYAEVVHLALETETCHENRLAHLGHLGMAARIFAAIQLADSSINLAQIARIENRAYASKYPGEAASDMRDAWRVFQPHLEEYIRAQSQGTSPPGSQS